MICIKLILKNNIKKSPKGMQMNRFATVFGIIINMKLYQNVCLTGSVRNNTLNCSIVVAVVFVCMKNAMFPSFAKVFNTPTIAVTVFRSHRQKVRAPQHTMKLSQMTWKKIKLKGKMKELTRKHRWACCSVAVGWFFLFFLTMPVTLTLCKLECFSFGCIYIRSSVFLIGVWNLYIGFRVPFFHFFLFW